jgi:four helix bundle protein
VRAKLRAMSRALRPVVIEMNRDPKMLIDVFTTGLQAASYKLQASGRKTLQRMRDFKRLLIWQRGMEIVNLVYGVTKFLPKEERFGLQLQMTKSAISIPSNIAEGSAKRSQKDYLRYVEISLGSAYELETQSLVAQAQGWVPADLIGDLLNRIEQEQRMISKFMEKL